jgi:hypothetical protein
MPRLLLLFLFPAVLLAQEAAPASGPTPERRPAAGSEEVRERVSEALAARLPKYNPPKPRKVVDEDEDEEGEDGSSPVLDKPRNRIIRLPAYVVEGSRPPVFREKDVYTKEGLSGLAMKRYMSDADKALNRFTLPFIGLSNEQRAMLMYAEDQRLREMNAAQDRVSTLEASDPEAAKDLKDVVDSTFIRTDTRPGYKKRQ